MHNSQTRRDAREDFRIRKRIPSESADTKGTEEQEESGISIVIPAFRGLSTIGECLQSVITAAQGLKHEIIVVESSMDGTSDWVQRNFPEAHVITSQTRLTAGAARNAGIRDAKGRFIFFVDQDCLVPPDWIERLLFHLQKPGVGAAGGSIAVANQHNISGWCVYFLEFLHHFPDSTLSASRNLRTNNFLIGANSAWKARLFRTVEFPDQTLGEDLLMCQAARDTGFEVIYDPSITVHHYNRSGWREFHRYCRAMGQAAAIDQARIGGRSVELIHKWPLLVYGVPLWVIPLIAWRLLWAPRGYLVRYIGLLPCCILGQLFWADAFRQTLINVRDGRQGRSQDVHEAIVRPKS